MQQGSSCTAHPTASVRTHFDRLLGSLIAFYLFNVNAIITLDRLILGLQPVVGKIAVMVVSDAGVMLGWKGTSITLLLIIMV